MILALEMPANVITSHFKFQLNHARRFRDLNLQKLAKFLGFFFFFFFSSFRVKVAIKQKGIIEIWYTESQDKGATFGCNTVRKWSLSYKRSFAKNNTNMLSRLQG